MTRIIALLIFSMLLSVSCEDSKKMETASGQELPPKLAKLKLQPGFEAEHLYSPADNDQGSWVAMAFDNKDRLITADQYGALYRLELPAIGSDVLTPKPVCNGKSSW